MRAVVVTPQLDWRLHAFDLLCEASGPPLGSSEPWPLAAGAFAVGAQYKAAEVPAHRRGLVLFRMDGIYTPYLSQVSLSSLAAGAEATALQ